MPKEGAASPGDIEALRRRKLERYERLARLASDGDTFPREPVDASVPQAAAMVAKFPVACLEFWAQWCAPCLRMKPVVEELAAQFWGDIAFVRVSLDASPEARDRWNVTVLPTMIVTQKGHEAARWQGALTRRRMEAFLTPYAGGSRAGAQGAPPSGPPGTARSS